MAQNFVQLVRPDYENINTIMSELEEDNELNESEQRTLRKVRAILKLMRDKHRRNVQSAMLTEKVFEG